MMEPPSEEQVVKVEEERRRGIVKMDSLEVEGEVVYDREGVIVQAKREDRLHSGRLKVTDTRCQIQPLISVSCQYFQPWCVLDLGPGAGNPAVSKHGDPGKGVRERRSREREERDKLG